MKITEDMARAAGRVLFERLGGPIADARVWTEHGRAALEAAAAEKEAGQEWEYGIRDRHGYISGHHSEDAAHERAEILTEIRNLEHEVVRRPQDEWEPAPSRAPHDVLHPPR